ncbi:unnamed protein product [marine sediment metagenome]|uniref:Uncharacterized protein n=1 Tax=marine sediment metagenome TaxID=412755 RepID=X1P3Q9_9ZZZZ
MEVSIVANRNFLVELNKTESNFIHELAAASDCKIEKVIADLTFLAIVSAHAELRLQELVKTHDEYWDH